METVGLVLVFVAMVYFLYRGLVFLRRSKEKLKLASWHESTHLQQVRTKPCPKCGALMRGEWVRVSSLLGLRMVWTCSSCGHREVTME